MTATAPRRVLVVEDDAKIAQLLLDYLRSEGFDASAVADGQVALRQIEAAPPSVIVLDLMLRLLLSRPGRVFSRSQLLDAVHDDLRDVSDRAIDSHIKNLRRKIEAAEPDCDCIASVYGVGYRFDA